MLIVSVSTIDPLPLFSTDFRVLRPVCPPEAIKYLWITGQDKQKVSWDQTWIHSQVGKQVAVAVAVVQLANIKRNFMDILQAIRRFFQLVSNGA